MNYSWLRWRSSLNKLPNHEIGIKNNNYYLFHSEMYFIYFHVICLYCRRCNSDFPSVMDITSEPELTGSAYGSTGYSRV